ncbi:MAG: HAD-IB family hydrolase [Ilumatobacteraceae bacterium]
MTRVVAAFDFDGTLTKRDTVVPFLTRVVGRPGLALGLAREVHRVAAAVTRRDRDRLRSIATDIVFAGRPLADIEAHAAAHAEFVLAEWIRPDTLTRLEWHQQQGHTTVVVSASYEQYVRPVADRLGVDGVVATRLEIGVDGSCTGRLDGPNCRGAEKVRRLTDWLESDGLGLGEVTLWAYGDSSGDRELLAAAQHPHLVDGPLGNV